MVIKKKKKKRPTQSPVSQALRPKAKLEIGPMADFLGERGLRGGPECPRAWECDEDRAPLPVRFTAVL